MTMAALAARYTTGAMTLSYPFEMKVIVSRPLHLRSLSQQGTAGAPV